MVRIGNIIAFTLDGALPIHPQSLPGRRADSVILLS